MAEDGDIEEEDGPGAAEDDDDDEYEATMDAKGAEANGGFRGDKEPEEPGSLPPGEDEPATEAASSLALSRHSSFRF